MMSAGVPIAESDWSVSATRGDLMSAKYDLERKIDRLDGKIDRVKADLLVQMKGVQLGVVRMIWIAAGAMGAVGILLRFF